MGFSLPFTTQCLSKLRRAASKRGNDVPRVVGNAAQEHLELFHLHDSERIWSGWVSPGATGRVVWVFGVPEVGIASRRPSWR